jgi:hypothetical protein
MKGFRSHHPPSLDFSWRNVRKPPREETAIGEGGAVPRGRYGDLSATAVGANGA